MGDWLRVELTYTSNAIEGNTLTRKETALVIEEWISPSGKKVIEIMEVRNHNNALSFIMKLAKKKTVNQISQTDIFHIHTIILAGIWDENAGIYRNQNVRIAGSNTVLPNYIKVPQFMDNLENWIKNYSGSPLLLACELHYKFVRIHPFVDGNWRTGRLLFNLVLLMSGYPLAFIATNERWKYLDSLEILDTYWDNLSYYQVMLQSVERSLDLYLNEIQGIAIVPQENEKLMKIGEFAKKVKETVPTIRYWTSLWLLPAIYKWPKKYAYYDSKTTLLVKKIRYFQEEKNCSLEKIKDILWVV